MRNVLHWGSHDMRNVLHWGSHDMRNVLSQQVKEPPCSFPIQKDKTSDLEPNIEVGVSFFLLVVQTKDPRKPRIFRNGACANTS